MNHLVASWSALVASKKLAWGEKTKTKTFPPGSDAAIDAWISKLPKKVQPLVERTRRSDGSVVLSVQWPSEPFDPGIYVADPIWDDMIPDELWKVTESGDLKDCQVGDRVWVWEPNAYPFPPQPSAKVPPPPGEADPEVIVSINGNDVMLRGPKGQRTVPATYTSTSQILGIGPRDTRCWKIVPKGADREVQPWMVPRS